MVLTRRAAQRVRQCLPVATLLLFGCAALDRRGCRDARDPAELSRLGAAHAADATLGDAAPADSQQAAAARRAQRVTRLATLSACGTLRSAADYRLASAIALAAPPSDTTHRYAYDWARAAVARDSTSAAGWLALATSWDRWQVAQGRPQWFGTQIICPPGAARCRLAPLDSTRVTDAERLQMGLRPLAQLRQAADSAGPPRKRR